MTRALKTQSNILENELVESGEQKLGSLVREANNAIGQLAMTVREFVKLTKFIGPTAAHRKRLVVLRGEAKKHSEDLRRTLAELGERCAPEQHDE